LEKEISENQADTTLLFSKLEQVQRLSDALLWQTLVSSVSVFKASSHQRLVRKVAISNLQQVRDQKVLELN